MLITVLAACSTALPPATPGDAGGDAATEQDAGTDAAAPDAGVPDAGMDTDLAAICGGTAPTTLDEWEDCFQRRRCDWQVACQPFNGFLDVGECVALGDASSRGQLAAERRARKRAVDQGRAQIDVAAFTQCLLRTSAAHCDTALFDPACLTRFTGSVSDGAACYTSIDCRSPDATCASGGCGGDACCAATCTPRRKEGQSCTSFRSCEPGLNCNGVCVAGDIGSRCRGNADCDAGAWCDRAVERCQPTLPVGAECTSLLQCGGDATCVGLSIAGSDPGRCARSSRPGDPCDDVGGCLGNLFCARPANAALGACQELPRLGEACSALVPCVGVNTLCSAGICAARRGAGVPCDDETCLPGLFCTSALGDPEPTCVARRPASKPCTEPGQCESFLCSGTPGVCQAWRDSCP